MVAILVSSILVATLASTPGTSQATAVNEDALAMADFAKRVEEYEQMRRNLMSTLPKRGEEASSDEIDRHRRMLVEGIREARAGAKPGELFTSDIQSLVRKLLKQVFTEPVAGASTRQAVNDDNPRGIALAVNKPYPENAPLTTMPPNVLNSLPKLPDSMQFRFIGKTLILLDSDAELIVDYMPNAMP